MSAPDVKSLPADLQPLFRKALEASTTLGDNPDWDARVKVQKVWATALQAAGFVENEAPPLASALTDRQRRALELYAAVPGVGVRKMNLFSHDWAVKQWLGVTPPGALFRARKAGPLIHALLGAKDKKARAALLEGLPVIEAIDAVIDLELMDGPDGFELLETLLWKLAKKLDSKAGTWAASAADRFTSALNDPRSRELFTAKGPKIRGVVALTVMLGAVRAKVPLRPEWDVLFTRMWNQSVPIGAEVHEIITALPADRRDAALVGIAAAETFENARIEAALKLLAKWPSAPLVAAVMEWMPKALRTGELKAQLKALAAKSPVIAAAMKGKKSAGSVVKLQLAEVEAVDSIGQLDKVAQAQLVECQKRYGGKKLTVKAILANDDDDLEARISTGMLDRAGVVDAKGARVYDAWFYGGDAGTFFRAGSTEVVADLIQDSVDGADAAIRDALRAALKAPVKRKKKATAVSRGGL